MLWPGIRFSGSMSGFRRIRISTVVSVSWAMRYKVSPGATTQKNPDSQGGIGPEGSPVNTGSLRREPMVRFSGLTVGFNSMSCCTVVPVSKAIR